MQMWTVKEYSTPKFAALKEGVQGEGYRTLKKASFVGPFDFSFCKPILCRRIN